MAGAVPTLARPGLAVARARPLSSPYGRGKGAWGQPASPPPSPSDFSFPGGGLRPPTGPPFPPEFCFLDARGCSTSEG